MEAVPKQVNPLKVPTAFLYLLVGYTNDGITFSVSAFVWLTNPIQLY
jgi:hypothetical protein